MADTDKDVSDSVSKIFRHNTYFLKDPEWEKQFENQYLKKSKGKSFEEFKKEISYLITLREKTDKVNEEKIVDFLKQHSSSIKTILTITGISDEFFKRVISLLRYECTSSNWMSGNTDNEWSISKIQKRVEKDPEFRSDIAKLFLDGKNNPVLKKYLSNWNLSKFSEESLLFETEAIIDRVAKAGFKGTRDAKKGEIPEEKISRRLKSENISYNRGEIKLGIVGEEYEGDEPQFDFAIPNQSNPKVMVEVSFEITTGSGMNRKIRDIAAAKRAAEDQMPDIEIVAFVDGIGWLARGVSALESWADSVDQLFTIHEEELDRFIAYVEEKIG